MNKPVFALSIFLWTVLAAGAVNINKITNPVNLPNPPVPVITQEKVITVKPEASVKQGETIFATVNSAKTLVNPTISFNGKTFKLYPVNKDEYRSIIGFDAIQKPGKYSLVFKDNTNFLNDTKSINLLSSHYPIQNIVVSGKTEGITPSVGELAKVQRAKSLVTDKPFWLYSQYPFNSPTNGCIISNYGLTRYHNGKPTGDFHKGVDIKAPSGREIRAVTGGKVSIAQMFRLHGGTVAIDHGYGLTSFYLHMSKINVKQGDIVKPDQKIGEVGSTGFATGPHLHWGLYVYGIPIDPMKTWIKPVPGC